MERTEKRCGFLDKWKLSAGVTPSIYCSRRKFQGNLLLGLLFTMLGLKESGKVDMIENMVDNFAFLINTYGHIPNGNRTYYLSRSQPPFFSLMVALLASIKGDEVYLKYADAMEKEYKFWMDGADKLKPGDAYRRVVKMKDGTVLNRYWDDAATPRPEGFKEDVAVAERSGRDKEEMYRNLRAGAESGIDFSTRWFADKRILRRSV